MILPHYDNTYIACSDEQFYSLVIAVQLLANGLFTFGPISDLHVVDAIYYNDDIYYSEEYLFKSQFPLDECRERYFNLARLIYLYYDSDVDEVDMNAILYYLCSFQ